MATDYVYNNFVKFWHTRTSREIDDFDVVSFQNFLKPIRANNYITVQFFLPHSVVSNVVNKKKHCKS